MDTNRLLTLVQVARYGSLTGAARALDLTPSAVSQQMTALEQQCGVQLIERQPRGVALTGAGLALLERAEELARVLDDTATTVSQLQDEMAGPVRVAAIASGAASLVLPAGPVLHRSAPAVEMTVSIREPAESLAALDNGDLDLALIDVYDHVPLALPSHLWVEEVLTEPLVLVTPRGADVAQRPTLRSLKEQRWVLPPRTSACGAATRYACRSVGFDPVVSWETDDLLLLVAAISRGEGVALLPRRAVADSVAPVELRRVVDPVLKRRLLLVARQGTAQRPIVRACMDAIQHVGRHAPPPSV